MSRENDFIYGRFSFEKRVDADPSRQSLIERARKVKQLADRPGTDGEGESARMLLERLRRDHKITDAEMRGEPSTGITIVVRGAPGMSWADLLRNATTYSGSRPPRPPAKRSPIPRRRR